MERVRKKNRSGEGKEMECVRKVEKGKGKGYETNGSRERKEKG